MSETTDTTSDGTREANPSPEFARSTGSVIRPHEQQTTLERVLRSHLWEPTDKLRRAEERLPGHVKRKEYREAAECQTTIMKSGREIEVWTYLLKLYEAERQTPNTQICNLGHMPEREKPLKH
jgi:hypothetical protein